MPWQGTAGQRGIAPPARTGWTVSSHCTTRRRTQNRSGRKPAMAGVTHPAAALAVHPVQNGDAPAGAGRQRAGPRSWPQAAPSLSAVGNSSVPTAGPPKSSRSDRRLHRRPKHRLATSLPLKPPFLLRKSGRPGRQGRVRVASKPGPSSCMSPEPCRHPAWWKWLPGHGCSRCWTRLVARCLKRSSQP